jgi:hypothetical protein
VCDWSCQKQTFWQAFPLGLAALSEELLAKKPFFGNWLHCPHDMHWTFHGSCRKPWSGACCQSTTLVPEVTTPVMTVLTSSSHQAFLSSQALVNSRSHFLPGQRGRTYPGGQEKACDWRKHGPSFAWGAVPWLEHTLLAQTTLCSKSLFWAFSENLNFLWKFL